MLNFVYYFALFPYSLCTNASKLNSELFFPAFLRCLLEDDEVGWTVKDSELRDLKEEVARLGSLVSHIAKPKMEEINQKKLLQVRPFAYCLILQDRAFLQQRLSRGRISSPLLLTQVLTQFLAYWIQALPIAEITFLTCIINTPQIYVTISAIQSASI